LVVSELFYLAARRNWKNTTRHSTAVKQDESNPSIEQRNLLNLKDSGHSTWSMGPLVRYEETTSLNWQKLEIKYGKNWGQVLLRYQFKGGVVVIPKSHKQRTPIILI